MRPPEEGGDVTVIVLLEEDQNTARPDRADLVAYESAQGVAGATCLLPNTRLTHWFEVGQYSHSVVLDDDWVVVDHGPTRMSLATLEAEL